MAATCKKIKNLNLKSLSKLDRRKCYAITGKVIHKKGPVSNNKCKYAVVIMQDDTGCICLTSYEEETKYLLNKFEDGKEYKVLFQGFDVKKLKYDEELEKSKRDVYIKICEKNEITECSSSDKTKKLKKTPVKKPVTIPPTIMPILNEIYVDYKLIMETMINKPISILGEIAKAPEIVASAGGGEYFIMTLQEAHVKQKKSIKVLAYGEVALMFINNLKNRHKQCIVLKNVIVKNVPEEYRNLHQLAYQLHMELKTEPTNTTKAVASLVYRKRTGSISNRAPTSGKKRSAGNENNGIPCKKTKYEPASTLSVAHDGKAKNNNKGNGKTEKEQEKDKGKREKMKRKSKKDRGKEEKGKGKRPRDATKFKKMVSDTKCASYITTLGKAMCSVALLQSDRTMGTCFRVGSKYLLTCWHVVKEIIGERLQNILCDPQCVRVTFDYDNDVENKRDAYYLNGMVWKREKLDACILALESTTTFDGYETHNRDPLVNFGDVPKINRERFVTIVGHPDGKSKEVDPSCEIISHTVANERIGNAQPGLYNGFDNKTRLLYNAWLEYGASGAPVFMQNHEKKAVCVAMHEKGYPLNAELRRNKEIVTFEQGILMSDIAKALREDNKVLAEEIFGKSLLQLTLSGGPHI